MIDLSPDRSWPSHRDRARRGSRSDPGSMCAAARTKRSCSDRRLIADGLTPRASARSIRPPHGRKCYADSLARYRQFHTWISTETQPRRLPPTRRRNTHAPRGGASHQQPSSIGPHVPTQCSATLCARLQLGPVPPTAAAAISGRDRAPSTAVEHEPKSRECTTGQRIVPVSGVERYVAPRNPSGLTTSAATHRAPAAVSGERASVHDREDVAERRTKRAAIWRCESAGTPITCARI